MANYTLITGATGGLGKAFVFNLINSENNFLLTGRSQEKLNILKKELLEINKDAQILVCPCNLEKESDRELFFEFAKNNNVKISKLINVAGCDIQKPFIKYNQDKIVFQSRVTYESVVSFTLFSLDNRAEKLEILTISSICGNTDIPYFAIYSSLKMAVKSFFNSLRYELRKDKSIVITTILPGSIPTRADVIEDIKKQGLQGKLSSLSPEIVAEKSLKALKKRKKNYIPGFYNKIVNFFQVLTPKFIKMKITSTKFSKKEKDAF